MQLGLRAKLTLSIVVLIVGFAAFLVVYVPMSGADVAREALRTQARSISSTLGPTIAPLIADGTVGVDAMLQRVAQRMGDDSNLAYLIVLKEQTGVVVASYVADPAVRDRLPRAVDETLTALGREHVEVREPIYDSPNQGAASHVLITGLSMQALDEARARGRASALIGSIIILVLGIGMAWLVGGQIATPILAAATKLEKVSSTLLEAARDQEASSAQEAAAVAETRRAMETLLDSAQQIAERSSEVLGNAERGANGSSQIAERIGNLNEQSENVADILATIMQVADKADLLALNASLEGTRAGDAGKGFALVASEMRRLAENVMESVDGIRALMKDIREASQAAVTASQEGTKTSTATTHSAREIALLTQEQRQATEQVIASMDEMGDILNHTLDGIQRTTTSATQLTELAGNLAQIVNPAAERSDDADGVAEAPTE